MKYQELITEILKKKLLLGLLLSKGTENFSFLKKVQLVTLGVIGYQIFEANAFKAAPLTILQKNLDYILRKKNLD